MPLPFLFLFPAAARLTNNREEMPTMIAEQKETLTAPVRIDAAEFSTDHRSSGTSPMHIRPYRENDRAAIRRICCDTGFLGEPVDSLFQDRELFADLFTRPYLEHEPGWALVAEVNGRVVGYLLGSVRKNFDWLLMRSGFRTSSRMALRMLEGHYADSPRSRRFVRWLFTHGLWEQPRHPAGAAHLHFDIDRTFRGRGAGRHLWDAYERRLLSAGVRECYGSFFSHQKRRPEAVYARFGFSVFDRRRTTLFEPEIPGPVEVVCVHKTL